MLSVTRVLCAALLGSSLVSAQTFYVSPPQALNVEGTGWSGIIFRNPTTRYQQVDGNLVGSRFVLIQGLAFRRDTANFTGATSRNADVQIDLGHGVATPTPTFDTNYKTNSRATVFRNRTVSLPDWRGAKPSPAPFDLVFNFDSPFIYNRRDPIVWDVLVTKNQGGGNYPIDWFNATPPLTRGSTPRKLGTGCKTGNGTFTYNANFTATAINFMYQWSVTGAPANAMVIAALGLRDLDAKIGWCTNLRTDALILLPAVTASSAGVSTSSVTASWQAAAAGVTIFGQAVAADSTQPGGLALTNGVSGTTPFVQAGGPLSAFKIYNLYGSTSHGPTGVGTLTALPVRYGL